MDEESFEDMKKRQLAIIAKLNQLIEHTIQEKKDVSILMKEIKELVVQGKPPRKQPKKKDKAFATSDDYKKPEPGTGNANVYTS